MCFCAQASFGAAGFLALTGLVTLKYVHKKSDYMLAAVPWLFSLQQTAEGVLWITLQPHAGYAPWISTVAAYCFLFFAFIVWPTWIPWALYTYENRKNNALKILGFIGIGISITMIVILMVNPLIVSTAFHHVQYTLNLPQELGVIGTLMYALPTVGSFFVCRKKYGNVIGIFLVISALITWIMRYAFFTSVWCFFAACISIFIVFLLRRKA